MAAARRSARPVRISLCTLLGGDIDGAWWPHTGSVAAELPDLIAALHRPLGEIVEIGVNWSTMEGQPDLNSMHHGAMSLPGWRDKRQRLITVTGRRNCARLLVVPSMTSAALGLMVLRRAAHLPIPTGQRETTVFKTADYVVRAAQAESASWTDRTLIGAASPDA